MRVAELYEARRFRLVEQTIQDPGPGEIQVRVHSVGICGSDLHNFSEGSVGDSPTQYPMVLGHEPTGTIAKLGAGVSGWSPGDRAFLEPAIYCYHCRFCLAGQHNICEHLRFLSQPGDPGYFRDFVNLPAHNVLPMPKELDFDEGTLFEPLAVALHSMKFAVPQIGEIAAVFGGGPIGLLTVAVLKLAGVRRIFCVEPVAARRELALRMGAAAAIDPNATDPVRELLTETGKRGVDFSIDCATKGETINQCLKATRHAGRVVVTGIPSAPMVTLAFHEMRRKELPLFNVRRSNHETEAAIDMMVDHASLFRPLVTHQRPLELVESAFQTLERYEDGVGKIVVRLA
jgi:L-iditol 2-dehydrogenase